MLSRSLKWTACLLTLLAIAVPVQASIEPASPHSDAVGDVVASATETAQDLAGQASMPLEPAVAQATESARDARATAAQTRQRIEATAADAETAADPAQLRHVLDDALRPVHEAVGDAQRQMDELLVPTPRQDGPGAESPSMTPQSTVNAAWPGFQEPALLIGAAVLSLGFLMWFVGQSATVGAGAAGSAALKDGRKYLPFASPLFTRFEKDTVLGHPKREAIYGTIIGNPGITLQDLCEQSGLSRTAVTHHLRLLEHQHLIVSKRVGRSRHFFENGGRYGRHQKDAYAVLHNDRSKDIHDFIQSNPGAIQKDLCSKFEIQASVAHWHVKRLLEANLLEAVRQGRTVSYFPASDVAAPAYA